MSNLFFEALDQIVTDAEQRMPKVHKVTREREGCGWDGKARVTCSCGYVGPWRYEDSDYMATDLRNDERGHS